MTKPVLIVPTLTEQPPASGAPSAAGSPGIGSTPPAPATARTADPAPPRTRLDAAPGQNDGCRGAPSAPQSPAAQTSESLAELASASLERGARLRRARCRARDDRAARYVIGERCLPVPRSPRHGTVPLSAPGRHPCPGSLPSADSPGRLSGSPERLLLALRKRTLPELRAAWRAAARARARCAHRAGWCLYRPGHPRCAGSPAPVRPRPGSESSRSQRRRRQPACRRATAGQAGRGPWAWDRLAAVRWDAKGRTRPGAEPGPGHHVRC